MTLRDLQVGKTGRVLTVGGEKALRRRLLDMGITPRTVIIVKKVAPIGDPIELCCEAMFCLCGWTTRKR